MAYDRSKILVVFGSTASGKSAYALELAKKIGGEIINCDSMQVYRQIPILSAQPEIVEVEQVPHHLYGFRCISQHYSAGDFISDVVPVIADVRSRGKVPILVGGTGMYLKLLMEGLPLLPGASVEAKDTVAYLIADLGLEGAYAHLLSVDREYAVRLNRSDSQRIRRGLEVYYTDGKNVSSYLGDAMSSGNKGAAFTGEEFQIMWLHKPRSLLYEHINRRFEVMVQRGGVQEVLAIMQHYGHKGLPMAHGLLELISYIMGDVTLSEAIARAQQITRNYAKRQITWAKHQLYGRYDVEVIDGVLDI
jgi:tRNA dimethylallyltransferase